MDSVKLSLEKRITTIAVVVFLAIALHLSALLIREAIAQTTHEVKIANLAFVPQNLTINLGDTIKWNNTDPVIHTLWFVHIANESTYLLSDPILPDSTWTYTFNDVVELQYYSFDKLWITGFIKTVGAEVHDIAVTNVTTSKDGCEPMPTVSNSSVVKLNVTVFNEGESSETFTLNAYADLIPIATTTITDLAPDTQASVPLTWDTTGFPLGNYTISAYAVPVPGEVDTTDNTFTDGWIVVVRPGDINGDTAVNYLDAILLGVAFSSQLGDSNWNPNADLNGDDTINYLDAIILGANFDQ